MSDTFATIIMAAGKGKRMRNDLPKVLHPLAGRPLVHYVIELARSVGSERILLVIGHGSDLVREATRGLNVEWVVQERQLGTGDAIKSCRRDLAGFGGDVLILSGDVPLLQPTTVERAWSLHRESGAAATVLTFKPEDPTGYGRIIRGESGELLSIIEQKDVGTGMLKSDEVNSGVYFFRTEPLFQALDRISNRNAAGEYYLTDTISVLADSNEPLAAFLVEDPLEVAGVNTPQQLSRLEQKLILRRGD